MKVSLKWLKNYIAIDTSREAVQKLTEKIGTSGLEVASVDFCADNYTNIISAQIAEKKKHPNADTLSLCKVTDGTAEYSVICGATNHKEGDKVILAKPGAKVLARGGGEQFEIKKTKLRGEPSEGMLCAFEELGLPGDSSGIIILPEDTPVGKSAAEVLGADDVIIEFEITANRGDALSHLGIARECAAHLSVPYHYPEFLIKYDSKAASDEVSVEIHNPEHCYRYAAMVVKDVTVGPSPDWMQQFLANAGVRPINNIVDITNFVMLEYGQPLHGFDLDTLKRGNEKAAVSVRGAESGQSFVTLDEQKRMLEQDDILICDVSGPIALGGIMGGLDSSITNNTKNILIESALFNPVRIRKTAQRLALHTDSSHRFERVVDQGRTAEAALRAAYLMQQYAGGKVLSGCVDVVAKPFVSPEITVRREYVNRVLGTSLSVEQMTDYLKRLDFTIKEQNNETAVFIPHSARSDIQYEIDAAEEIARLYGLDNIESTIPYFPHSLYIHDDMERLEKNIRQAFVASGFNECVCYSFVNPETERKFSADSEYCAIKIGNPISEDMSVMRRSIIPSLISALQYNLNRGYKNLRLFELSKIYLHKNELPDNADSICEEKRAAFIMCGTRSEIITNKGFSNKEVPLDIYDAKGVTECIGDLFNGFGYESGLVIHYLSRSASFKIMHGKKQVGFAGKIDPKTAIENKLPENTYIGEITYSIISDKTRQYSFTDYSRFPAVNRDFAVVVDDSVAAEAIIQAVYQSNLKDIESVELFDVFRGIKDMPGKKSVAFNVLFRSSEGTLSDKKVDKYSERILKVLEDKTGAKLR